MQSICIRRSKLISLFILIFIISIVPSYGISIPKVPTKDIFVQDYAGILSKEVENNLLKLSSILKDRTSAELVVVTITSLEGHTVEDYALSLFRKWNIGSRAKNNGVLLLIAYDERETRIEVGYGLEGAINDGKAGAILDKMIPYFKDGNYDVGITVAHGLILEEIAKEYNIDMSDVFTKNDFVYFDLEGTNNPIPILILPFVFLFFMFIFSRIMGMGFFQVLFMLLSILGRDNHKHRGGRRPPGGFGGGGFGGGSSGGGGASRKW